MNSQNVEYARAMNNSHNKVHRATRVTTKCYYQVGHLPIISTRWERQKKERIKDKNNNNMIVVGRYVSIETRYTLTANGIRPLKSKSRHDRHEFRPPKAGRRIQIRQQTTFLTFAIHDRRRRRRAYSLSHSIHDYFCPGKHCICSRFSNSIFPFD